MYIIHSTQSNDHSFFCKIFKTISCQVRSLAIYRWNLSCLYGNSEITEFIYVQRTVCPGSSDPPEKIFNTFASENEGYNIY